jgi:probable phosphoglycerate mutase
MAVRRPGQKILVVSHGGVLRALIYGILNRNFDPDETSLIKPYHCHILAWENGELGIEAINAVCLD